MFGWYLLGFFGVNLHELCIWFLSAFDWIIKLRILLRGHYIFSSHGSNRLVRLHAESHIGLSIFHAIDCLCC